MRTLQAPNGFVKMADGRTVPASRMSTQQKQKARKLLLVIQYYGGDMKAAEELASLIADLERTRNHEADILLFRRADTGELSAQVVAKLQSKFGKVTTLACRRIDARGYPFGCNQMFSDLLMLMSSTPPFATDYYAFINGETDMVPTRPGWIGELIAAWKGAMADGKAIAGHFCSDPFVHVNGLAVYSSDVYRRAGGNTLAGGSPQITYDIRFAPTLTGMAKETPLIYFKYRQPTITPEELFAARSSIPRPDIGERVVEGVAPALYHGVKDGSARAAVRARHISFTDKAPVVYAPTGQIEESATETLLGHIPGGTFPSGMGDVIAPAQALGVSASIQAEENPSLLERHEFPDSRRKAPEVPAKRSNVFCYHQPASKVNAAENHAILVLWRKAWTSRGWNPTVLTLREAAMNQKFDDFQVAIERFPYIGGRKESFNRFNRWLALEQAGGGLLVDMDVLPGLFTPADVVRFDIGLVLSPRDGGEITAAVCDKAAAAKFIDAILKYDAKPEDMVGGRETVTDMTVWLATNPAAVEPTVVELSKEQDGTKLIRFTETGGVKKSAAMDLFLSGVKA